MNLKLLSYVCELLGLACLLVAAFLFDWRAGLAVSGAVLVLVGYMLDDPQVPDELT